MTQLYHIKRPLQRSFYKTLIIKPNENPSVGIVLCKDADKNYAEYMVRTYDKPMGVATFKTAADMPEKFRNALPDIEDLKKLL